MRVIGRSTGKSLVEDVTAAYLLAKADEEEKQKNCKHKWTRTTYDGVKYVTVCSKCLKGDE